MTALAATSITTLAKREKPSSMNMPWKAARSSRPPSPTIAAAIRKAATVAQSSVDASRSLPR